MNLQNQLKKHEFLCAISLFYFFLIQYVKYFFFKQDNRMIQNVSKSIKIDNNFGTNNTNIHINFNIKDKLFAAKKIDNLIIIDPKDKKQQKKPTVVIQTLKQKKKCLEEEVQKETNDFQKPKKLDILNFSKIKKQPKYSKTNRSGNQFLSALSTSRIRSKNQSKQLKQFLVIPKKKKASTIKSSAQNKRQKNTIKSNKLLLSKKKMSSVSVDNIKKYTYFIDKTPTKSSHSASRHNSMNTKKLSLNNIQFERSKNLQTNKAYALKLNVVNQPNLKQKKSKNKKINMLQTKNSTNLKKQQLNNKHLTKSKQISKIQQEQTIKKQTNTPQILKSKSSKKNTNKKLQQQNDHNQLKQRTIRFLNINSATSKEKKQIQNLNLQYKNQYSSNRKKCSPNKQIVKIQKVWRGYNARKKILKYIQEIQKKKKNPSKKLSQYWENNSNSIIKVAYQIQKSDEDQKTIQRFEEQYDNQIVQDQKSNGKEEEIKIDKIFEKLQKYKNDQIVEKKLNYVKFMMKKQQQLKQKFTKQNEELKQTLKLKESKVSNKQSHYLSNNNYINQDAEIKHDFQQLKQQKNQDHFIHNPQQIQNAPVEKQFADTQCNQHNYSRKVQIQDLKKFREQSDKMIQKMKKRNIQIQTQNKLQDYQTTPKKYSENSFNQLLIQKQKILAAKQKKFEQVINTMYINKLVSPRTYTTKLNSVQKSIEKQKKKIHKYMKQIEKINVLIKNIDNDQVNMQGLQKLTKQQRWSDALNIINSFSSDHPIQYIAEENQNEVLKTPQKIIKKNIEEQPFPQDLRKRREQQINTNTKFGFDTNLNYVKEYCIEFCEFIRSIRNYKQIFKKNIKLPLKIDAFEYLKSYRETINNKYTNEYNYFKYNLKYPYFKWQLLQKQKVIPNEIFLQFSKLNKKKINQHNKNTIQQLEYIYHLALFDIINQALNYQKPYSLLGQPLPWISQSKYLKNLNIQFQVGLESVTKYPKEDLKFDQIFGVAIARIIKWGSTLCGFIPESLQLSKTQLLQIDQEYVNHIKQTRMALMLEKSIGQQEIKFLDIQQSITEVKLYFSQQIFDCLLAEMSLQLSKIIQRKEKNYGKFDY